MGEQAVERKIWEIPVLPADFQSSPIWGCALKSAPNVSLKVILLKVRSRTLGKYRTQHKRKHHRFWTISGTDLMGPVLLPCFQKLHHLVDEGALTQLAGSFPRPGSVSVLEGGSEVKLLFNFTPGTINFSYDINPSIMMNLG